MYNAFKLKNKILPILIFDKQIYFYSQNKGFLDRFRGLRGLRRLRLLSTNLH